MKSLIRGGRRLALAATLLALVGGFPVWLARSAEPPPGAQEAGPAQAVRPPWTTSRVVGSPDPPPPFKVVAVGEHAVLPHGQVRPRSHAAHRRRTAGRGGLAAHRGGDHRHGRRAW